MSKQLNMQAEKCVESRHSNPDDAIKERNEVTGYFDMKLKKPLFDREVNRLCSKLKIIQTRNKELNKIISDFDKRYRYINN